MLEELDLIASRNEEVTDDEFAAVKKVTWVTNGGDEFTIERELEPVMRGDVQVGWRNMDSGVTRILIGGTLIEGPEV